jgi:hypothetical protein
MTEQTQNINSDQVHAPELFTSMVPVPVDPVHPYADHGVRRHNEWVHAHDPEIVATMDRILIPTEVPIGPVPPDLYEGPNADQRIRIYGKIFEGVIDDNKTIIVDDYDGEKYTGETFTEEDPDVLKSIRDDAYLHAIGTTGVSLPDLEAAIDASKLVFVDVQVDLLRHELRHPRQPQLPETPQVPNEVLSPNAPKVDIKPLKYRRSDYGHRILRLSDFESLPENND